MAHLNKKYIGIFLVVIAFIVCQRFTWLWYVTPTSWLGYLSDPEVGTDSSLVIFTINKKNKSPEGVLHVPDNSLLHLPAKVRWGDSIFISVPEYGVTFKGIKKNRNTLQGKYTYRSSEELDLVLENQKRFFYFYRPQTPNDKRTPYYKEEVTFKSNDGFVLQGTYCKPSTGYKYPAVVLIHDKNENDRDATIADHKRFLVLSDYLVQQGIAVLRYDKRNHNSRDKTSIETLASDVEGALEFLKVQKEIDSKRIGLIGHGEGAVIASIVENRREDVAFIVSMAGYGASRGYIDRTVFLNLTRGAQIDEELFSLMPAITGDIKNIIYTVPEDSILANWGEYMDKIIPFTEVENEEWTLQVRKAFTFFFNHHKDILPDYEPGTHWQNVTCPVLILHGEKDPIILSELHSFAINSSLEENGNISVSTILYPDLNHYFQTSETGWPSEYTYIEETIFSEVMEDISGWILSLPVSGFE